MMDFQQGKNLSQDQHFSCGYCEIAIGSILDLKEHLLSQHKEGKEELKFNNIKEQAANEPKIKKRKHGPQTTKVDDKKKHICDFCGKSSISKSLLKFHVLSVHQGQEFPCDQCNAILSTNKTLSNHKKIVHEKIKDFKCDLCDVSFGNKKDLSQHIELVHFENSKTFQCKLCEKSFTTNKILMSHCRKKHKDGPLNASKTQCELCDKEIFSSLMQIHMKKMHEYETKEEYQCAFCSNMFSNLSNLKAHVRRKHSEDFLIKDHECETCKKTYRFKENLMRHRKDVHSGKNYKCDFCGDSFTTEGNLKRHRRTNHLKPNIKECEFCDFKHRNKKQIMKHQRLNHLHQMKDRKCNLCNKSFSHISQMELHKKYVHENKKDFKCHICFKTFSQNSHLRRHQKALHVIEREKFDCFICSKKLLSKHNLKLHIKKFHDEINLEDKLTNVQ